MRTVPRHSVYSHQRGTYVAICSICGDEWPREALVKKADGLFYCPDDVAGKDPTTLNREIAACSRAQRPRRRPMDAPPTVNVSATPPAETLENAIRRTFGR